MTAVRLRDVAGSLAPCASVPSDAFYRMWETKLRWPGKHSPNRSVIPHNMGHRASLKLVREARREDEESFVSHASDRSFASKQRRTAGQKVPDHAIARPPSFAHPSSPSLLHQLALASVDKRQRVGNSMPFVGHANFGFRHLEEEEMAAGAAAASHSPIRLPSRFKGGESSCSRCWEGACSSIQQQLRACCEAVAAWREELAHHRVLFNILSCLLVHPAQP